VTVVMEISSYNLSWPKFSSCFTNSFKTLSESEQFSDITLICEQNQQLRAHKIILGACSLFFRNILTSLPQHQPCHLYVDGVAYQDLRDALRFIYLGEVKVEKDNLDIFMAACHKLELLGLSSENLGSSSDVKNAKDDVEVHVDSVNNEEAVDDIPEFAFKSEEETIVSEVPGQLVMESDEASSENDHSAAVDGEGDDDENNSTEEIITFQPHTVVGKGMKSLIWRFYNFKGTLSKGAVREEVYCTLCSKETKLAYSSGTTSLWNHVKRHHGKELKQVENIEDQKKPDISNFADICQVPEEGKCDPDLPWFRK